MHSLLALSFASLLPLSLASAAQNPRAPQILETSVSGVGSTVATAGDLSALVSTNLDTQELLLRTSDGRGIDWSPPVRIDALPGLTESLSSDCIAIVGDRVYVSYSDQRHGTRELFVRSFDAGTGALSAEVRVPNDYAPGEAETFLWQIAAEPGSGADRVYFAIVVDLPTPNIDRLRFVGSHDGASTFPLDRQLTPGLADAGTAFRIEAVGGVVHLAWADNRHWTTADDVFYQRSGDGGLTFLPADLLLDASGPGVGHAAGVGFHMAVAPPIVAVGWSEYATSILDTKIHGCVSLDGGLTFGPDNVVDQAPPGTLLSFAAIAVAADPDAGSAAVAWNDARFGLLEQTELFAATTFDGGVTWSEAQLSSGGILGVAPENGSVAGPDGRTWMAFGYAGYYTGEVFSAQSLDGGATWEPPISLAGAPHPGAFTTGAFATNELYGNRIHAWAQGEFIADELKVGGYRVPTLDFVQDAAGPSFHFELSELGSSSFGAVVLSGSPGSLPVGFGDPRDLGLAPDAILLFSLGEAFGALGASLTGGAGATPSVPLALPPGLGLYAAGISFDVASGVAIGEITDVQLLP